MRKLAAVVATLCVLFLPAAAEQFTSAQLGFSADFPTTANVGQSDGSEKDNNGNFISHAVMTTSAQPGYFVAIAVVDSFDIPFNLDIPGTLATERDNFLKSLNASITASHTGTLDGNQATFFTYDTADHSASGSGVVAVVAREKPRVYMAATMYTPNASSDQVAALGTFLESFHIN